MRKISFFIFIWWCMYWIKLSFLGVNFDFLFLGECFIIEVVLIEIWVDFLLIYIMISGKECLAWCVWLIGIDEVSMILMSWCEFLIWGWHEFDDKNMTSIKWCCLWIECSKKVLILLVFEWFWDCIFSCLLDEILWIEYDFWLSSRKRLIYKGLWSVMR